MSGIFISYSRKDETFAYQLASALEQHGRDVWIDREDIHAGKNWSNAIQQGLDNANVMVIVLSPDSMASVNVTNEWQYFLDNGKTIIPVLLRPTKVHFQLHRLQYIDFTAQTFMDAFNQLMAELDLRRGEDSRLTPLKQSKLETLPPGSVPRMDAVEQPGGRTPPRKRKESGRSFLTMAFIALIIGIPVVFVGALAANQLLSGLVDGVVTLATQTIAPMLTPATPTTPTHQAPTRTPTPEPHTATPTLVSVVTPVIELPSSALCPADYTGYLMPRLNIGVQTARIVTTGGANRLRQQPSVSSLQIGMIGEGVVLDRVYLGPACTDGYVWWLVQTEDQIGWTAESSFAEGSYYVEPYPVPTETPTPSGGVTLSVDDVRIIPITLEPIIPVDRFLILTPFFIPTTAP
ncbi:MAG: toll/interleukin-1 receptor domain-containing protein [Anaerolineaceae bacterium]|nr:toll/interleukin-1 receptor domain-containing protein [Anaerolineaceae bacterium]